MGRVLALGMVILLGQAVCAAQEVRAFGLTDVGGYLELRYRDEQDERRRAAEASVWETHLREYRERLRIDTESYFYHPRFAKLQLGLLFEIFQEMDGAGAHGRDRDLLIGGDVRLTLLDQHPYTLALYGSRQETDVNQSFARGYLLQTESLGASFHFRKGPLPFDVSYDRRSMQGFGDGSDIDEVRDDLFVRARYTVGTRSDGNLEYHYTKIDERRFARTFETNRLSADNITVFGAAEQLRLLSNLRFHEQVGYSTTTTFSARESLTWRHNDNLYSQYHVAYDQTDLDTQSVESWNAGASLSHQLYDSLHSQAEVYGRLQEANFGKTTTYGGAWSENYTKRLGEWGRLGILVRVFAEVTEREPIALVAAVADEAHTLNIGLPVQLGHLDIDVSTILVTDDRGVRPYTQAMDYQIAVRGDVVEITSLALGDIPDGATVLVDYRYQLASASQVLTSGGEAGVRLGLQNWLSVYSRYSRSTQELMSGAVDTRLEDLERITAGSTVTWRWFNLNVEYEDRQSVFSPATTLSESLSLNWRPWRGWHAQVAASHRDTEFGEGRGQLNTVDVHGMLVANVTRRAQLTVEADWRQQRWDEFHRANDLDAYGVQVRGKWRYRKLSVEGRARVSMVDQRGQKEDRSRIELTIRREF
ncbi:MAG: hypothetical protein GWP08_01255 [Nitrospiraceae bacterium]|nr:hypothetical protein [Nitrospiraceae bacterium]